ncbi:MAG: GNAT family protein [Flavobacteriales bacterium]|nr:GNAT family protein [Flavobacteriales bacterium]
MNKMIKLTSERLRLRSLEPSDLTFFMAVENDASLWNVCDTRVPFSRFTLEKILETSVPDIFKEKQLRLVICLKNDEKPIGFVDFYDFSPLHHRCGVGVIIYPSEQYGKGYAKEALTLAFDYAFKAFDLNQIWAEVSVENEASNALFSSLSMVKKEVRPQWLYHNEKYTDVSVYHLFKKDYLM